MTSRELTSAFEFWSGGYLRMATVHLPIKFGVDICIQSRVIDIFSEIQDGGCLNLGSVQQSSCYTLHNNGKTQHRARARMGVAYTISRVLTELGTFTVELVN